MSIDFHGVHLPDSVLPLLAGTYEQHEMAMAEALFQYGDRVVVAGAGMGWLAAWVAQHVGAGNVLAVEPLAHLARLVAMNVAVDGQGLQVQHGALTPDGLPSGITENPECWALSRTGDGPEVPGVDLRQLQRAGYDCLALDVEGAEVELLTPEVLGGMRKLLVELHGFAVDLEPLHERLHASGLTLRSVMGRPDQDVTFQAWVA